MGYVRCLTDETNCNNWFEFNEKLDEYDPHNRFCYLHGGKPLMTPMRRCIHMDERGIQCDTWFNAETDDKLCEPHRTIASPSARNGQSEEQKVRYIDLVNEQRVYCYHFKDGTTEQQDKTLIFEFKDNADGTVFDKLDRHIAFLEKVLEDVKIRLSTSRAVKGEKLDKLSEEERKELRKIRITRAVEEKTSSRTPSIKKDPLAHLMKTKGISQSDAKSLLNMDPEELIAKFKAAQAAKEQV